MAAEKAATVEKEHAAIKTRLTSLEQKAEAAAGIEEAVEQAEAAIRTGG
jgi:hypothetical protein